MSIAEVDLVKLSALTDSIDASLAAATEALSSVDVDPNYISYTIGTLPDSTGAVNGTIGSYFTSAGLLQKLEWNGTAWVTIGQQISSKNYVDDKASLSGTVHFKLPGTNPQTIFDFADAGDKIVFTAGLHEHPLQANNACLYIDKSIEIEIMRGATFKVADGQSTMKPAADIITNQFGTFISDAQISVSQNTLPAAPTGHLVEVTGTGEFRWAEDEETSSTSTWTAENIPFTIGTPVDLNGNISITFSEQPTIGAKCLITYQCTDYHAIRVGKGTHTTFIEDVYIYGKGTIDGGINGNLVPGVHALTLSGAVFVNGRVKNCHVTGLNIVNSSRGINAYAEYVGGTQDNFGGATGGNSYNINDLFINHNNFKNCGAPLFGHPEHRGLINGYTFNYNTGVFQGTCVEPNLNSRSFEVIGNILRTVVGNYAIHCWRGPKDGVIANNLLVDSPSTTRIVEISSPPGWPLGANILTPDNNDTKKAGGIFNSGGGYENSNKGDYSAIFGRNNEGQSNDCFIAGKEHLIGSDSRESITAGNSNTINGINGVAFGWNNEVAANIAAALSGKGNRAAGVYTVISGGENNEVIAPHSFIPGGKNNTVSDGQGSGIGSARGYDAVSRDGEESYAQGMFAEAGDAQEISIVSKGEASDGSLIQLSPVLYLEEGFSGTFEALVIGRKIDGTKQASYKLFMSAHREVGANIIKITSTQEVVHETDATWDANYEITNPYTVSIKCSAEAGVRWVAKLSGVIVKNVT